MVFGVAQAAPAEHLRAAMAGDAADGGLATIARYVRRHPRSASLTPLTATGSLIASEANWSLIAPSSDSPDGRLESIHFLRVGSRSDATELADELRRDARIEFVSQPAPQRSAFAATGAVVKADPEWGINKCGFPDAWRVLDQCGEDPGPIGVLDTGGDKHHDKLAQRITEIPVLEGKASPSDHAMAVAGVIAARRDIPGVPRGCCSANVNLYNVFTVTGHIDHAAICTALADAARKRLPVVNMSMSLTEMTPQLRICIDACVASGVIIVAAMGGPLDGDALSSHPDVVAVGGTNANDAPEPALSRQGAEMFVAAPAVNIVSVNDRARPRGFDGTSFAAPMVSSAVWLARYKRPDLTHEQVLETLRRSVHVPNAPRTEALGYGRLDMPAMQTALGL